MKTKLYTMALGTLATAGIAGALFSALPASAQVAGVTSTVDARIVESTQIAMGWSVKKTLLGKTIYNDAGIKVGNVEDLIISPDKKVTYVIVGAGGFVGIGRHDVAIPITQIQDQSGKLVMPGATKDRIDLQVTSLQVDVKSAESKLSEMKQAAAVRWKEFEASVSAATARIRKSVESATS
jgi:hypothetical protein